MKQFLEHIKQSIYGPEYYKALIGKPFAYSWKYYSAFALLIATVLTIIASIPLVPGVIHVTRQFPPKFFAYYPDELEIRFDKGAVSTNVPEPYILPVPEEFARLFATKEGVLSLAVIDTQTPFSLEKFDEWKTIAWLGREQIAIKDDRGSVRIETFAPEMSFTVNEGRLRLLETYLAPFYPFAAPLIVILVFVGFLLWLGVYFIYLILGALFIFILGRIMKHNWTYGASYRMGLHAMTLPLLLDLVLTPLTLSLSRLPFLFTAILLAVIYANWKDTPPLQPTPAPQSPTPPASSNA